MAWPVIAEISTGAIAQNLDAIRKRLPRGTPICAAVKADGYGHGLEIVLPVLARAGIERVAVANLEEALQVRRLGWPRPVLCFGAPLVLGGERGRAEHARLAAAADIICTVSSVEEANLLSGKTSSLHRPARVAIKVDTGMGRMGLLPAPAEATIADIAARPGVIVEDVYTHFATSDGNDLLFAKEQVTRFRELMNHLRSKTVPIRAFHAANSAAIFRLPESHLDCVRPGLAVYGYWGGPAADRPPDLKPALRAVSQLSAVRRVPAGHSVGYGCTFVAKRDSIIGVVPIGYADGYRRSLSNDAVITLEAARGRPRRLAPVVGRVSMDQSTIDLTDAGDVQVGDRVVVIDDDPVAPNSVESLAAKLGTIPYEITCLLGQRVQRIAV